ncbi:MAG: hypothetical protein ACTSYB_14630, partial [Candidatus Helarchaeota archaeon]
DTNYYWEYNDTQKLNIVLDPSTTVNNTFFIGLVHSEASTPYWHYLSDSSDGEDEGVAYKEGTGFLAYDFKLKVDLIPISNTPSPSQINMKVNGSAVNPNGNWNSSARYTSASGAVFFNVTADWPLAYNVSYYCEYNAINITQTTYFIDAGENPNWWVNWSAEFPANATDYQMNITIPIDWTVINIWNRTGIATPLPYSSDNWRVTPIDGQKVIIIKNLTDVAAQDWAINCTAPNYVTKIELFRETNSFELLGANPLVYITDVIHINGTISSPIAGLITDLINGVNLTIYLPGMRTCHSEENVKPSNGLANFTNWVIADTTNEPGTYRIQIIWANGTEVGMDEVILNIIYPTTTRIFVDGDEYLEFPPFMDWYIGISDILNITVFYNNTFYDKVGGISTPNATYRVLNETDVIIPWTYLDKEKFGVGFYNVTLNTTTWINGTYFIGINLNKTGFLTQDFNITLNVVVNTSLSLIEPLSTVVTNYYTENLTIRVNYTKLTGEAITFANVDYLINGSNVGSLTLEGSIFKVEIASEDYGIGNYNITIVATASGYKTRYISIYWTVAPPSTEFTLYTNGSYSSTEFYYGEQMKITIHYRDTTHNLPIQGALVNLTVSGETPITLSYDGYGNYSTVLNSSARPAGLWNISIVIQKPNYINHTWILELYARYNTTMEWVIPPPTSIRPGDELKIAIRLYRNPPLAGQNITFVITTNVDVFNETVTTNASGIAEYSFFVLSEMDFISIQVIFPGNLTDFTAGLSSTSIRVIHGGFLEQYWWVILLGAILLVTGVAAVRVRQKQKQIKELRKKEILTSFQDVTKILHLVVIHKETGVDIFDYRIQERLDPTLLAGFIQAVKDFGKELDQGEEE